MRHMLMWHMMRGGGGMARHGFLGFMMFGLMRRLAMKLLFILLIVAVVVLWMRRRERWGRGGW